MPRILLLITLGCLLYFIVKHLITKIKSNQAAPSSTAKKEETIVACSQCGLHIPESESHLVDDAVICNNPACNIHKA